MVLGAEATWWNLEIGNHRFSTGNISSASKAYDTMFANAIFCIPKSQSGTLNSCRAMWFKRLSTDKGAFRRGLAESSTSSDEGIEVSHKPISPFQDEVSPGRIGWLHWQKRGVRLRRWKEARGRIMGRGNNAVRWSFVEMIHTEVIPMFWNNLKQPGHATAGCS